VIEDYLCVLYYWHFTTVLASVIGGLAAGYGAPLNTLLLALYHCLASVYWHVFFSLLLGVLATITLCVLQTSCNLNVYQSLYISNQLLDVCDFNDDAKPHET
jgi:hypothetical protein